MSKKTIDREQLIRVIFAENGKVAKVAERFEVSTRTIYNYVNEYATVRKAVEDARQHFDEDLLDTAESKLRQSIEDGAAWAVRYVLSTKGKIRGYTERHEITGADGGKIEVDAGLNKALERIYGHHSDSGTE